MDKIKIQKLVINRKTQIRSKSNKGTALPSLTQSYTPRNNTRKMLSPPKSRADLLETQVSSASKKLEMDKINLRILKERLNQKKNIFNSLEGKPQKILIKKKVIKHKLHEPIKRIKGKEREIIDKKIKTDKEKAKSEYDFKKVTDDIDILIQNNYSLKKEILFSRIKRLELEKIKQKLINEILTKKNKLKEIQEVNNHLEKNENSNILNKEITTNIQQQMQFESLKTDLEGEYDNIIRTYIKKERENLKEIHFNRKISELRNRGNMLKFDLNEKKNLEIKKELQKYEDEKIGDRTPILDECLEKWRRVNQIKKESINKYIKNCALIRESLDKLVLCLNVDSYKDLPEIFEKTEERESNINLKKEKIENENIKLQNEKENLMKSIELIQSMKKSSIEYKNKFMEQKKEKIKVINNLIKNFERDIRIKEKFFEKIQPETDKFLKKLNNTYLSEFIPDKIDLRENNKYNYITVNKYLSNIEDYINLVYDWEDNNDIDNFEIIENQNLDKLNLDIKQKLESFNKYKIIDKSLLDSMQINRKNGLDLSDIIKSASRKIMRPINHNSFSSSKTIKNKYYTKSKEKTTENSEEDNYKNQFDTQSGQQSSILYQNSSNRNKN